MTSILVGYSLPRRKGYASKLCIGGGGDGGDVIFDVKKRVVTNKKKRGSEQKLNSLFNL